jgi:leucyl/phenylalanyl-tRNA--protein transferase
VYNTNINDTIIVAFEKLHTRGARMILDIIKSCFIKADKCLFKEYIMGFYLRNLKYRGKALKLNDTIDFPPHTSANKNVKLGPVGELLAIGGDQSPERMMNAYKNGIWPCSFKNEPLLWWTSEIRCVIFPENIHISKVVKRLIKQNNFELTVDKAFDEVIKGCCEDREDCTWLRPEQIVASAKLHELDFAHSLEVWRDEKLIAGLFGISFGSYFYVESKFTRVNHASKAAMIALAIRLEELSFTMIDCGIWPTNHLEKMGAVIIPRDIFLEKLNHCVQMPDVDEWESLYEQWNFVEAIKKHELKNINKDESIKPSL